MKKLFESIRGRLELLKAHRVSLCVLFTATLFIFIDNLLDFVMIEDYELIFIPVILVLAFAGIFLAELLFTDYKKWIGTGIAAVLAITLGLLLRPYLYSSDLFENFVSARIMYIACGYGLILCLLVLFFAWKKSGDEFRRFAGRVFRNCVLVVAASLIIGGLILILLLVIMGLFGEFYDKALSSAAILIFGFITVPGCMAALLRPAKETGRFFAVMIRVVFPIFEIAAILIGYTYMVKLIVQQHLPSNSIFGIMTALFMICFVFWMIDDQESGKNFFSYVRRYLPVAFLPLFALQSLALFLRIRQYGFTPWRYSGLVLLIFELAVIIFLWFKTDKLQLLVLILAALIGIATILPVLNIPNVARWSKTRTWAGNQDVDEDVNWDPDRPDDYTWFSLYVQDLAPNIQLSGFDTMRSFSVDLEELGEYSYETGYPVDYAAIPVIFSDNEEKAVLDLSEFLNPAIAYVEENSDAGSAEQQKYLRTLNPALQNKDTAVYLTQIEMSIQQDIKDGSVTREVISQFDLRGVVLSKGQN